MCLLTFLLRLSSPGRDALVALSEWLRRDFARSPWPHHSSSGLPMQCTRPRRAYGCSHAHPCIPSLHNIQCLREVSARRSLLRTHIPGLRGIADFVPLIAARQLIHLTLSVAHARLFPARGNLACAARTRWTGPGTHVLAHQQAI
ncbi:hypothetical protein DFH06DRAFT_333681 [Mycena polygramma]|nr:hypothetical protein DFH06DRAFT_333681 [Mycena polygramma]